MSSGKETDVCHESKLTVLSMHAGYLATESKCDSSLYNSRITVKVCVRHSYPKSHSANISCHVISYHAISYHVMSYHAISYHVISCHLRDTAAPSHIQQTYHGTCILNGSDRMSFDPWQRTLFPYSSAQPEHKKKRQPSASRELYRSDWRRPWV